MVFRVADSSTFTFTTDLPPSSRNIHPSGILHAFRSTYPAQSPSDDTNNPNNDVNPSGREEHTFSWITNSLHIESAIKHLEQYGYERESVVFIPYSTKENWLDRYPHAEPSLEINDAGKVVVYLNWRPYPNGLGRLGGSGNSGGDVDQVMGDATLTQGGEDNDQDGEKKKKKRVYKSRARNILNDNRYLPDAERDELHVEIYNYFAWLTNKLGEIERRAEEEENVRESAVKRPKTGEGGDDEGLTSAAAAAAAAAEEGGEDDDDKKPAATASTTFKRKNTSINGVDVSELRHVVDKLQSAFAVIPNAVAEAESLKTGAEKDEKAAASSTGAATAAVASGEAATADGEQQEATTTVKRADNNADPPFLEEALTRPLSQLVAARELSGKKRRSRKRKQKRRSSVLNADGTEKRGNRTHPRTPRNFDEMYLKLVKYKEEKGDCLVSKNYKEDQGLAHWVRGIREKKATMLRKGIEVEVPPEGKAPLGKTLTAERIQRLNDLGFQWTVAGPKVAWEDRFNDLMEYYNTNGKWPSQSLGQLGEWVHKQRTLYAKKDKNYMKTKAGKLDEVGFEWTPRGNTRMNWDEGFELLMAFGRLNGHFDVPCPPDEVSRKTDQYKLYSWVKSLHSMYRSYKLGRKSGSLTDDRVVLLIKNGFVFREDS